MKKLSIFFGSMQRTIVSIITLIILWAAVEPMSLQRVLTTGWNNVWFALGPIVNEIIPLVVLVGCFALFFKCIIPAKTPTKGKKK